MNIKTIDDLRDERKIKEAELKVINDAIEDRLRQTLIQCTNNNHGKGCGMGMKIGDIEYIQTHWYTKPHGCMDGDYWNVGDGEFICPHCNHRNRLYDRPEIMKLKRLFKSVVETYDK